MHTAVSLSALRKTLLEGTELHVQFSRIVPILGTVSIPQRGMNVEVQAVSGDTLWLSADAFGTVTVASPASNSVGVLHSHISEASEGAEQYQVPAVNLQSCAGLVHVVSAVREAAAGSMAGSGAAHWQLIAELDHASGVLSAQEGGEREAVQALGARRGLSRLQPALVGKSRGILQETVINNLPPDPGNMAPDISPTTDNNAVVGPPAANIPGQLNSTTADAAAPSPDGEDSLSEARAQAQAPGAANTDPAEVAGAVASNSAAPAEAPSPEESGMIGSPERQAGEKDGFFSGSTFFTILAACVAAVLLALCCCGLYCHRRRSRGAAGPSKSVPVRGGRAMSQQQGHEFDNNFSNSMHLRNAQNHMAPMVRLLPLRLCTGNSQMQSPPYCVIVLVRWR